MLAANKNHEYKRLLRTFRVGLDLQEHISVSLHNPEEVQKLVERSHAEAVIRWNAQTVAARLRVLADDILYHRYPTRFNMDKQLARWKRLRVSTRITRSGNLLPGISAASPGCYAPSARFMPGT